MTVPEIYAAALELFGATVADATDALKARCLLDINSAIQQMAQAGEDFYGRELVSIDLTTGVHIYVLEKNIQTVLNDNVVIGSGAPLRRLTSSGQMQLFSQLFQDSLSGTLVNGTPIAYFVNATKDTDGTTGAEDSVKLTLHLRPPPDATAAASNLLLNVIREPTPIVLANLTTGTVKIPVPHKYIESIFLPLVRWNASSSYFFVQKDMLPRFEADYARALNLLGVADPRKPKPNESNADALRNPQKQAA